MVLLVNKNHIFNEKDIENFEMVEYENYKEKTLFIESETFKHFEMLRAHLKVDGIIMGKGVGNSKKSAEQEAAKNALSKQAKIVK